MLFVVDPFALLPIDSKIQVIIIDIVKIVPQIVSLETNRQAIMLTIHTDKMMNNFFIKVNFD